MGGSEPKESDVLPKFAYAYEKYCVRDWLSNWRSNKRIGIVGHGQGVPDSFDDGNWLSLGSEAKDTDGATIKVFCSGYIGVPLCTSARHQSPHLPVGNLGVRYSEEDVVDGKTLHKGDVVVYDLAWLPDPAGKKKAVRYATNIILVEGTAEYTGDPMEVDEWATMLDSRLEKTKEEDGTWSVSAQHAHYKGEKRKIEVWPRGLKVRRF